MGLPADSPRQKNPSHNIQIKRAKSGVHPLRFGMRLRFPGCLEGPGNLASGSPTGRFPLTVDDEVVAGVAPDPEPDSLADLLSELTCAPAGSPVGEPRRGPLLRPTATCSRGTQLKRAASFVPDACARHLPSSLYVNGLGHLIMAVCVIRICVSWCHRRFGTGIVAVCFPWALIL